MFSMTLQASAALMLLAAVHAGLHHPLVEPGHALQGLGRVAGHHLGDVGQAVLAVARVDALGAVADEEVALPHAPAGPLELGHADLLGGSGVDRGLVDHHQRRASLCVPMARLAPSRGWKSGMCAASTGVGIRPPGSGRPRPGRPGSAL